MKKLTNILLPLFMLLPMLWALGSGSVLGQETGTGPSADKEIERRVHEISDGLRCPTCQAISVNDSEAAFSKQIRDKVRRMVIEGQSEEDIKAYFVSRYGEWILRAPKKEGLGLVLWILPILLVVVGAGLIFYRVYHRSAEEKKEMAKTDDGITEQQRKRIEKDLRAFEDEE